MQTPTSSSFTVTSNGGILRVLLTPCEIAEAFDQNTLPPPQLHQFQAIWDTGATNSLVTQAVVDTCGLKPIGVIDVRGVGFSGPSDVYLINVGLMNKVMVPHVRVAKGNLAPGADMLIGMDIITIGDFVITNQGGRTVFSFCVPSHRCIDFVKEHNDALRGAMPRKGFLNFTQPPPPRRHK